MYNTGYLYKTTSFDLLYKLHQQHLTWTTAFVKHTIINSVLQLYHYLSTLYDLNLNQYLLESRQLSSELLIVATCLFLHFSPTHFLQDIFCQRVELR